MLHSICSHCTYGYLAGNVRSVGIRLDVIEWEAEDSVPWDALWEGKDYACALCNEEESGELAWLWGGGGRISFWCKVKVTALVLIPWEGNQKCFAFLYILFCVWKVRVFVWIDFSGWKTAGLRGGRRWSVSLKEWAVGIQEGWVMGWPPFFDPWLLSVPSPCWNKAWWHSLGPGQTAFTP